MELNLRVSPDEIPAVLQAFIRQLLDPEVVELVRVAGNRPVEIRLYANRGNVRRQPMLLLNGGSVELVDPDEV